MLGFQLLKQQSFGQQVSAGYGQSGVTETVAFRAIGDPLMIEAVFGAGVPDGHKVDSLRPVSHGPGDTR